MRNLMSVIMMGSLMLLFGATLVAQAANPKVLMKTSKGDITLELYPDKAPITVKNFLAYVDKNFYDDTIFHRVIAGFMIQGGGLTADFHEKGGMASIKNEAGNGLSNLRGTVAMARTGVVDSATSQFFINHKDNDFLNHQDNTPDHFGYCVFGKVLSGMEVVDAIAKIPTTVKHGTGDVPRETVTILSVRRVTN